MRILLLGGVLALLLGSCDARRTATITKAQPTVPVAAVMPAGGRVALRPDTADCTRASAYPNPGPADTLIALGSRHYWLSIRIVTDSTRALYDGPASNVGAAFAPPGDSVAYAASQVRGYQETYTFALRDSTKKVLVFRRQLHKPDFYKAAPRDIVTVMHLERPNYLGYSAALEALVFGCYLWIPSSDVGVRATLLLDRQGHLKTISPSGAILWEATDCDPQLSPSGRAVLTCTELLRAGQPPLQFKKPHAQLRAARFLNDSTLLVVYEHGDERPRPSQESSNGDASVTAPITTSEFVTTPAQHRLPTALILRTSGRVLRTFSLKTTGAASCQLLRVFMKATRTYFLYDEDAHKLVLIPKAHPDSLIELPLKLLPTFKPPLHPHEQKVAISSDFSRLQLYIDTLHPRSVRYRLLAGGKGE